MEQRPPWGQHRLYNKEYAARGIRDVIWWDVFPVVDGEVITVTFEAVNSERRQGVWLRTDRGLEINGQHCGSADLWYDTAPREVLCTCHTSDGHLSIYNITTLANGHRISQAASSGMLVEELPCGRRYRCNDIGFDTAFDKLVFRVERVECLE